MNLPKSADKPSCSYIINPEESKPKGIMKSTPKVDKIVSNIWKRQLSTTVKCPPKDITVVTIEDTSTEDSPGNPGQIIEVVNLESTDDQDRAETNGNDVQAQEPQNTSKQVDTQKNYEEHEPAITSPAKSSILDLHASDFFNPSEF